MNQPPLATPVRKFNIPFLIRMGYVFVAMALAAVGIHFLHEHQIEKNAGILLRMADHAEQIGETRNVQNYLHRYLRFHPHDIEVLIRYADLMGRNEGSSQSLQQALMTYETVLRLDPNRPKIRQRVAEISIDLYRFQDALNHLEILLESAADQSTELIFMAGKCYEGLGEYGHSAQSYLDASKLADDRIDIYEHLIELVRQYPGEIDLEEVDPVHAEAPTAKEVMDRLMDIMVERGKPKFRALLARSKALSRREELERAFADVESALQIAGHEPDVLHRAAMLELLRADDARYQGKEELATELVDRASEHANEGLSQEDPDLRFFILMSEVERMRNDYESAMNVIQRGLAEVERRRPRVPMEEERDFQESERQLLFSMADLLISLAYKDNGQVDQTNLAVARSVLEQLEETLIHRALIHFLRGRILFAEENWHQASIALEENRPELDAFPGVMKRVDLMLSDCYLRLDNPDARLVVFRRALKSYPLWVPGRLGYASALVGVGRLSEALQSYSSLTAFPGVPLRLAELLVYQQMSLPPSQQRWGQVKKVLDFAEKEDPDSYEVALLRSQWYMFNNDLEAAEKLLNKLQQQHRDQVAVWAALVQFTSIRTDLEPAKRQEQALQLLNDARKEFGDHIELRKQEALLAGKMKPEAGIARLAKLEQNIDAFAKGDQLELLKVLATAYSELGAVDKADSIWKQLGQMRPEDISIQMVLFDIAGREGDEAGTQAVLERIRQAEGPDGPCGNYVQAMILLNRGVRKRELGENLTTARDLLEKAATQRPYWALVAHARGVLEDLSGNLDVAYEHYNRALSLGDRSREVIGRVVQYLASRQRFDEADDLLKELSKEDPNLLTGSLARLGWKIAWEQERYDQALGLAGEVAEGSTNYSDLIWVAQLRYARGQRGRDVERPLRQAVEMASTAPETWYALLTYLVREGRESEAEVEIQKAAKVLPQEVKRKAIGRCYELIGREDLAVEQYRKAVEEHPGDLGRILVLTDYYVRIGDMKQAEPYLSKIISGKLEAPDYAVAWAKRRRAMQIASGGSYDDTRRALKLLSEAEETGEQDTVADMRVKAMILSARSVLADQQQAISLWETIAKSQKLTAREQFMLAQLYEVTDDWNKARGVYQHLLAADPNNIVNIIHYTNGLIERGDYFEAEVWVRKLEELQPNALLTVQFRASLLHIQGRTKEAVRRLREYIKNFSARTVDQHLADLIKQSKVSEAMAILQKSLQSGKQDDLSQEAFKLAHKRLEEGKTQEALALLNRYIDAARLSQELRAEAVESVGQQLEKMNEPEAAEEMYRAYVDRSNLPEARMELAVFLARQGRFDEALKICEESWKDANPDSVATTSVAIVEAAQGNKKYLDVVEGWLLDSLKKHPDSTWHYLSLALLQEQKLHYTEAILNYQRVVQIDPEHILALNNLAWLMSLKREQPDQALEYINRAISVLGPIPQFLDTRASVYMALNQPEKAIVDLEVALKQSPRGLYYYHLAQAHLLNSNPKAAQNTYFIAQDKGFDPKELHPLERRKLKELQDAFAHHFGT